MTFFKKYMALVIGGGIALLLAIIVLVLLLVFSRNYAEIQDKLSSNQRELERLTAETTFPSVENVQRVEANLEELEQFRDELLESMSAHQPQIVQMERAVFITQLSRVWHRLRTKAVEQDVKVADNMYFGFELYAPGNLPMQQHVERLLSQLHSMNRIGEILIDSGVSEIVRVEREVFEEQRTPTAEEEPLTTRRRVPVEQDPRVPAPAVSARPQGVDGLFTRERFTVVFLSSEQALFEVLNRMAADPVLMIVRNLELHNEMGWGGVSAVTRLSSRLQPRDTGGRLGEATGRQPELSRPPMLDDRVVAGRERIEVRMIVDVYRFEYDLQEVGVE